MGIRDMAKAKMAGILSCMDTDDPDCGLKAIDRMLDEIPELAVINRDAKITISATGRGYKTGWNDCLSYMLKEGYVKEVK